MLPARPPPSYTVGMGDLFFVGVVVAFFALMVLLVRACDHVIGPDGPDLVDRAPGGAVDRSFAAGDEVRP